MMYLCKCDKCGVIEKMICLERYLNAGYLIPDGWKDTDMGDLCKKCYEEYKKHIKKFI